MLSCKKLTCTFDQAELLRELRKIESNWELHFNTSNYQGDWSGIALRTPRKHTNLIVPNDFDNTGYKDTILLKELTYIQSIIQSFKCKPLSVRLLKLAPGSSIKTHKDPDLTFWNGFVRIHIPIRTNEKVQFLLDGKKLVMKPGECWFGEFCKPHSVANNGSTDRIHLVIDLEVNDWLRGLFENEGILERGESKPNPIDGFTEKERKELVKNLLALGTETGDHLAKTLS